MLFEFFKKLFWRADGSSRKRKNCEHDENEFDTSVKKSCKNSTCDGLQNYNEVVETEAVRLSRQSKFKYSPPADSTNFENNVGKFEMFEIPVQWSSPRRKDLDQKNSADEMALSSHHSYALTNFTLYKAQQLTDRQKYSRMLLNFVNPKVHISKQNQYIDNSKTVEQSSISEQNEYMPPKYSIGPFKQDFDMKNKSPDSLYFPNPRLLRHHHSNAKTENNPFQCSHKTELNLSTDSLSNFPTNNVSKTNTLKEQFDTREVIKQNFIVQLTEKYNISLDLRNKEAEEIKKMTHILAKHNRIVREAALEDHLNRSMRLCEAIIDERDLLEFKLPQLDSTMMKTVESALLSGPGNEILVQEFGLRITRKDIQTLNGLNWLNDEIINFYMNLLITRGNSPKYPSVYAMNTFFYPKLVSGGHSSLKRWTRKIDIFSKDLIVVPIHLGIHWCVSIIDFKNKTLKYYDSMGSPNYKCLQVLKQYLQDEYVDKKKKTFEFLGWNCECMKNIPLQMNGSDCGVFSCMFAEYICSNKKLDFSQEDMPYFRKKMVYEILTVKLL